LSCCARQRPRRRRAAEQRDELAPLQLTKLHALTPAKVTAYRIGEGQSGARSAAKFGLGEAPVWVKSGPTAMSAAMSGLPESGHRRARSNLPTPTVSFNCGPRHDSPAPVLSTPVCVVGMRRKLRMRPARQPSPTGVTDLPIENSETA
jgi:hypothetical protein